MQAQAPLLSSHVLVAQALLALIVLLPSHVGKQSVQHLHVKASLYWIGGVPQKQPKSSSLELLNTGLVPLYILSGEGRAAYGTYSVPQKAE